MCDFLLTCGLLLSLAGLYIALRTIMGGHSHDACERHELSDVPTAPDVYGQSLVETYLGYRQ